MARRILAVLCAAVSLICLLTRCGGGHGGLRHGGCPMDADSGRLLYEKNGGRRMLIASTTKLMTALVALEQGDLQREITVTGSHMAEARPCICGPGRN